MSNIPKARAILQKALEESVTVTQYKLAVTQALGLMTRDKPAFVVRTEMPAPSEEQIAEAKSLRKLGKSLQYIATHTGMQIGRVSEAVGGVKSIYKKKQD